MSNTTTSHSGLHPFSKANEPMISVRNLRKSFNGREVLKDVSFDVWPGEMLALIGPSGCGKSTTLKLITGLLEPDDGEIVLNSKEIGLVFQGSALLNSLTVRENLALALRERKLPKREQDRIIMEDLTLVGLADYVDSFPTQLSGGQQKRTSFARAIVNDPKIVLYDEPTTGLDPVMSTIIEDYMIELENQLHAAGIVVTHQFSTWTRTAHRAILMHDGVIVWEGKPDDAMRSSNPYIVQFAKATKDGPMLTGTI
jgi:phospholipid/cholesterol/gamma-HCH transport system ATP-binding protein